MAKCITNYYEILSHTIKDLTCKDIINDPHLCTG